MSNSNNMLIPPPPSIAATATKLKIKGRKKSSKPSKSLLVDPLAALDPFLETCCSAITATAGLVEQAITSDIADVMQVQYYFIEDGGEGPPSSNDELSMDGSSYHRGDRARNLQYGYYHRQQHNSFENINSGSDSENDSDTDAEKELRGFRYLKDYDG